MVKNRTAQLLFHVVLPILYISDWFLFYERKGCKWYYPLASIGFPLTYALFLLIQAVILKFDSSILIPTTATPLIYPYFFVNPETLGVSGVLMWIGILFGGVSAFASSYGVEWLGAVVNVRDAAPLTAGLVFGAPVGIIAGVIGGLYRWLSVYWGAGVYTQLACSLATALAGCMAAGLRIPDLAKMESLSHSRYITVFKERTGMTPSEYVIHLRLNVACDLLRNRNVSVKEAAACVGYDNPHFFSKLFKKKIGVSPQTYKEDVVP